MEQQADLPPPMRHGREHAAARPRGARPQPVVGGRLNHEPAGPIGVRRGAHQRVEPQRQQGGRRRPRPQRRGAARGARRRGVARGACHRHHLERAALGRGAQALAKVDAVPLGLDAELHHREFQGTEHELLRTVARAHVGHVKGEGGARLVAGKRVDRLQADRVDGRRHRRRLPCAAQKKGHGRPAGQARACGARAGAGEAAQRLQRVQNIGDEEQGRIGGQPFGDARHQRRGGPVCKGLTYEIMAIAGICQGYEKIAFLQATRVNGDTGGDPIGRCGAT